VYHYQTHKIDNIYSAFTKALVCLSKYGDTVTLSATQEHVSLSAANSAKSAFCLFKYEIQFFSRYSLSGEHEGTTFTGQLMTKVMTFSCIAFKHSD